MPRDFRPRLEILPSAQRRLWYELRDVPPEFALYGGTALALHLGHRTSVDFEALERAPAGIIDARSWAYWNSKMGRYPAPPMPTRRLE